MGKDDQQIMVVDRAVLFKDTPFQGFMPLTDDSAPYLSTILRNYRFMRRGDVEKNPEIQQPIPYIWIVNPVKKEVFAYRRAAGKSYNEARLRNKWSCGIGGHIDSGDAGKIETPFMHAVMRELREEVKMPEYSKPKLFGYLKDDSDPVNSVHFGLVSVLRTTGSVEKGDDEMAECGFFSIADLEKLFADAQNDIEKWTMISWPYIRQSLR